MLEAPDLGNEDGAMPKEQSPGKPTTRRYTPEEKASAVRMVRVLREELGTDHGTVQRVARHLGYGIESVRSWVRQPTSTTACPRGVVHGVCAGKGSILVPLSATLVFAADIPRETTTGWRRAVAARTAWCAGA